MATVHSSDADTEFEPIYHHYTPHRAGLPPRRRRTPASCGTAKPLPPSSAGRRCGAPTPRRSSARPGWCSTRCCSPGSTTCSSPSSAAARPDAVPAPHRDPVRVQHHPEPITQGATSVTGSGKLLINTAFPRLLIPLSAVRTAFFRFLPTIPVYLVLHLLLAKRHLWHPMMLGALYFLAMMVIFSMGLAAFFAALHIYFRDTSQFLPYFVRLWMYLAPVLWLPEHARPFQPPLQLLIMAQPALPAAVRLRDAAAGTPRPAAVDVDLVGGLGVRACVGRVLVLRLEGA